MKYRPMTVLGKFETNRSLCKPIQSSYFGILLILWKPYSRVAFLWQITDAKKGFNAEKLPQCPKPLTLTNKEIF